MCSGSVDADNIRANQGLNGVAITGKLDFHAAPKIVPQLHTVYKQM